MPSISIFFPSISIFFRREQSNLSLILILFTGGEDGENKGDNQLKKKRVTPFNSAREPLSGGSVQFQGQTSCLECRQDGFNLRAKRHAVLPELDPVMTCFTESGSNVNNTGSISFFFLTLNPEYFQRKNVEAFCTSFPAFT
jgi:hypothetical protein